MRSPMETTPRQKMAQLVSLQELNAVTWNEALAQIDALVDLYLLGQFVNTPPSSPQDGDCYLVGGAPTGAWSGYAYKIAACLDGAWRFYLPFNGQRAFVASSNTVIIYVNGTWTAIGSTDYATKTGSETLTNKTLGATNFPSGKIDASGKIGIATTSPGVHLQVGSGSGAFEVYIGDRYSSFVGIVDATNNAVYGLRAANNGPISDPNTGYPVVSLSGWYDGLGIGGQTNYNADGNPVFGVSAANQLAGTPNYGVSHNLFNVQNNGVVTTYNSTLDDGSGKAGFGTTSPRAQLDVNGAIFPHGDNSFNLGSASYRWGTVYAGTGTINTSGSGTKTAVRALNQAEIAVAKALARNVRIFQFVDAVAQKGEAAARLHVGMIYEDVVAAFAAQNLDPARYGIVCRDVAMKTVTKTRTVQRQKTQSVVRPREQVVVDNGVAVRSLISETVAEGVFEDLPVRDVGGDPVLNADGSARTHRCPVMETVEESYAVEGPDLDENGAPKTVLGLRYGELAQFVMAGLAARLAALDARL